MLLGIDYASVDDNAPPNWALAKQPSADGSRLAFVIARASYGESVDQTFVRDWAGIKAAGLVRGSYLYPVYEDRQGRPVSVSAQVDTLEIAINAAGGLDAGRDLPPALDVESVGSPMQHGCTAVEALAWYRELWVAMRESFGVAPMIYTSGRVWSEDLDNLLAPDLATSAAWLAKPWPWKIHTTAQRDVSKAFSGGAYDPQVPLPWGGGNWWIHQYQGDAISWPGFTSTVDCNRFNLMRPGERGSRVSWVQRRVGATPDGDYGPKTEAAVKMFQAKHGLAADGVVGPLTLAPLCWMAPS